VKYILTEETKRQVEQQREKRLAELAALPFMERVRLLFRALWEAIKNGTSNKSKGV